MSRAEIEKLPAGHPLRRVLVAQDEKPRTTAQRVLDLARAAVKPGPIVVDVAAPSISTVSVSVRGRPAIIVPGVPVAQGRGRAVRRGARAGIVDPERSRTWKGVAATVFVAARRDGPILAFPFRVEVDSVFPRPKHVTKRYGTSGRVHRPSKPDADNLAKAVLDAGNAILWTDDALAVELVSRKWYAAEGEDPHVEVRAWEVGMSGASLSSVNPNESKGAKT